MTSSNPLFVRLVASVDLTNTVAHTSVLGTTASELEIDCLQSQQAECISRQSLPSAEVHLGRDKATCSCRSLTTFS